MGRTIIYIFLTKILNKYIIFHNFIIILNNKEGKKIMNILKICIINLILFFYTLWMGVLIFSPQGLLYEAYKNYKNISYIKKEYTHLDKKIKYLEDLINNYKSGNKDIKNFLFFLKFNKVVDGYENK